MNTFGKIFKITTFGESHGEAVGAIIDGCPSGIEISLDEIQKEVDKRKPISEISTERKEEDKVEILSGIFENKTLGTPISLIIYNKNIRSEDYEELKFKLRPGHGDWTWREKFDFVDYRGGGRSSARETVARVACGAIAKKILEKFNIKIFAHVIEIAGVKSKINYYENFKIDNFRINNENIEEIREKTEIRCLDLDGCEEMRRKILEAKEENDSVGGIIEAIALNVPAGIGEPIYNKLSSRLAYAFMSIPGVKGVEIGKGFELARMRGSESNDEIYIENKKILTKTNNCGGILGGISNGMPIVVRIAFKPTSSIGKLQNTVDIEKMENTTIQVKGRHDTCIVPRAVPVVESMMAFVLVDFMMIQELIPRKFL